MSIETKRDLEYLAIDKENDHSTEGAPAKPPDPQPSGKIRTNKQSQSDLKTQEKPKDIDEYTHYESESEIEAEEEQFHEADDPMSFCETTNAMG